MGGVCYHVLNRGNGRAEVFHKKEDYIAFLDLMAEAGERLPMRLLAWCLMPNHFHLVLWPHDDGDLSRWMQWLARGNDWLDWVNRPQSEAELAALRKCIQRGMPYGNESWQHATAERLGLEASLHPRGRPRQSEVK